jgi:hypothetical protein
LKDFQLCLSFEAENYLRDSGFRREVHENCALLGYCAASRGNSLPIGTFSRIKNHSKFLALEDGTDMMSRNVGKELPLHSAQ